MTADPSDVRGGAWIRAALERHERALVAWAARITGDGERARDAVQETFLKLCRERDKHADLRDEGRLREWLFTVCRNQALDVRRKESRMQPLDGTETGLAPAPDPEPGAELERRETVDSLLRSLARLPGSQQEVLQLRFRHGFSYKEISRVTGHSVSNVGYLLHVALRSLRERHAPQDSEPDRAGELRGGFAS